MVSLVLVVMGGFGGAAWPMHVIDASSRGADGVRLADANGDGWLDLATPWEQGGVIRVYVHPGPEKVREPWPAVTVGKVPSPEDAVLVDLDGDGALDVVSACEGMARALFVHWAPTLREEYLEDSAWRTQPFPAAPPVQWMYVAPADIDGRNGIDLVVGAKNERAMLGWLESPAQPRDLSAWQWRPITPVGWIMSIVPLDKDGDGDLDILITDRKGAGRGCYWLEHPGRSQLAGGTWAQQLLFGADAEVMFLDIAGASIACATADAGIFVRQEGANGTRIDRIPWPEKSGTGKAAALGDIDLDGQLDVVISAEHAQGERGVQWVSLRPPLVPAPSRWQPISALSGTKYDAVRLYDMDGDGDLDVLTCEERENLGVIWYENPLRRQGEEK